MKKYVTTGFYYLAISGSSVNDYLSAGSPINDEGGIFYWLDYRSISFIVALTLSAEVLKNFNALRILVIKRFYAGADKM